MYDIVACALEKCEALYMKHLIRINYIGACDCSCSCGAYLADKNPLLKNIWISMDIILVSWDILDLIITP